jgi:hypothetical protein
MSSSSWASTRLRDARSGNGKTASLVVNTAKEGRNTRDSNRLNNRAILQPYGVRKQRWVLGGRKIKPFSRSRRNRRSLVPQARRRIDEMPSNLAEKLRLLADRGVFIGTSSWKYRGWLRDICTQSRYETRGNFSQAKFEETCLAEYAETFPVVFGVVLPATGGVRWLAGNREGSGMSFSGIGRSANPRCAARRAGSMAASRW